MKLGGVLLACNENTKYLHYWPFIKNAWNSIVGIPALMVFVGEQIPEHLRDDPCVSLFKYPKGGPWPTATVAQVIRLLMPALIQSDDAVLISDMDCAPLNGRFFHQEVARGQDGQFLTTMAPMDHERQVAIMYCAAQPKTWRDMFGINHLSDIYQVLELWAASYPADGSHSGKGWCTDQLILYKRVQDWKGACPHRLALSTWDYQYPRLCRSMSAEWISGLTPELRSRLFHGYYIDFHMPPHELCRNQITEVLAFAKEVARHPGRWR
jgi:hypothetical protein